MSNMVRGRKSTANKEQVLAEYKRGDRLVDISKKHGCSAQSVVRWAEDAGLPMRGKGGGPNNDDGAVSAKALTGGDWVADSHGIQRWVPDEEEAS